MQVTKPVMMVLAAFLAAPDGELAGVHVGRRTKLSTGTLYPILLRLEKAGWLTSRWEDIPANEAGRPRMRFYKLTYTGTLRARAELNEIKKIVDFIGEAR